MVFFPLSLSEIFNKHSHNKCHTVKNICGLDMKYKVDLKYYVPALSLCRFMHGSTLHACRSIAFFEALSYNSLSLSLSLPLPILRYAFTILSNSGVFITLLILLASVNGSSSEIAPNDQWLFSVS